MSKYGGMTTNERLAVAGLMDAFDDATRRGDRAAMIDILLRVEFTPEGAERTADQVLAEPTRYGRV